MKAVILAGGLGTRISEESHTRPKPMIEIGGKPILWHVMKQYASHGITEFVICCGYKGYVIKEYFANYFLHMSDVTFDMSSNSMDVHQQYAENWRVTLVDTGENTMTGGRLARVADHLQGESTFCMTYGDGVSDIDIAKSIDFHKSHGKRATLAAMRPPARFGALNIGADGSVNTFKEKPKESESFINGGFFVLDRSVIDLVDGDQTVWEQDPLETLAASGELMAFKHSGFFQPMDTLRDKNLLEELWVSGKAPWKTW